MNVAVVGGIVGKSNANSNNCLSFNIIIFSATSAESLTLSCARL